MTASPPPGASCSTCPFWQRGRSAHRHEATEYLRYRPCGLPQQTAFRGHQVIAAGGDVRTSPDSVCGFWAGETPKPPVQGA